jgi:toxin ParE1/3/4
MAQSTIRKLYDAARSLKQFSERGRSGQLEGTRELVMTPLPYIIVYAVEPQMVHIFRIIHTSEDWP